MVQPRPRARRAGHWIARILAPLFLLGIAAVIALIVNSAVLSRHPATQGTQAAATHRLPPYWTVRSGDTFGHIAAKTGLSVQQLQAYNPNANQFALTPGQRLNLWAHPPQPKKGNAKAPGAVFWVVKPGQSFGSIAASTGIDITKLEQLNPGLKPGALQPGDEVRLRH